MRRSDSSVKKVKWLMPDARATTSERSTPISRQMRATPIGPSWHMPTLRTDVARLIASVTRLIGLDRLMRNASGAYRSMSAQMPSVLRMLRNEWNTAPGPPFSPWIWRAP